jgi:hypothetical protein
MTAALRALLIAEADTLMRLILMDNLSARKLIRSSSLTPEETDIYRRQTADFRRKFGRDMGPDDPFFFDPEGETPRFRDPAEAGSAVDLVAALMEQAGMEPAHVYAFRKTGGLLPPGIARLTGEETEEWEAAVAEYYGTVS